MCLQLKVLTQDMIRSMAKDPIIFAMANPVPEIMPDQPGRQEQELLGQADRILQTR